MGLAVVMAKRIILPIWACALLGACAFNSTQVSAQGAAAPVSVVPVDSAAPGIGASTLANLQAPLPPAAVSEPDAADVDPASESGPAAAPSSESPAETVVAAPPPMPACPENGPGMSAQMAVRICQKVRSDPPPTHLKVDERTLRAVSTLVPFYAEHGYQAVWFDGEGQPLPAAEQLIEALGEADQEGLRASDYPRALLRKQLAALSAGDAGQRADLDLLLTDTFLTYANHLLSGRLSPRSVDPDWAIKPRSRDLGAVLREALASGKIGAALRDLAPHSPDYTQLRNTLHQYRQVEKDGGWPMIADGPALALGAQGPRVRDLRTRLHDSGDLKDNSGKDVAVFDKTVATAVRCFQKRHGLAETGVVNAATRTAMNVPVSERIRQVELNMERWRWLPDEFGSRYILVNIPSFKMRVIENGKPVIESNVVVGRLERQTPTFTANMKYLVLSPQWYVPRSIAVKDKLPQLKRNAQALARQNIRIYNSAGQAVNPGSINWGAVSANNFNYQLRQDSGPRNALGRVKFMFPNRYNVYLHDTPSRELFSRNQRTFSSGCIRVSNPLELAEYLLKRQDPSWNMDKIKTVSSGSQQRVVSLHQEVPVYLLYWTVWADEEGLVHFLDDVYKRDPALKRALSTEPVRGGNGA